MEDDDGNVENIKHKEEGVDYKKEDIDFKEEMIVDFNKLKNVNNKARLSVSWRTTSITPTTRREWTLKKNDVEYSAS